MYSSQQKAVAELLNEKLTVFDRDSFYIATKKIGENNPKAEQIKKDNDMGRE